jgi:4-hydroxy-2-oxoheptanedioate aldolase
MRTNHVKAALQRGEASLGAWLALASVPVARVMAAAGFEWLLIDMEHSAHTPALMADMVAAVAAAAPACAPLVRVPGQQVEWFKWALDAGAWGIIVPMIGSQHEAEQVAGWSRYPPQGVRSIGGAFAHTSFAATREEYAAAANREILLVVQIESIAGLDNLEGICSVPGVDAIFVGPYDLRSQLGLPPASDGSEPAFVEALEHIKATAQSHALPVGIYCSSGPLAARRMQEGFRLVSVTSDSSCLSAAARQQLQQAGTPPAAG